MPDFHEEPLARPRCFQSGALGVLRFVLEGSRDPAFVHGICSGGVLVCANDTGISPSISPDRQGRGGLQKTFQRGRFSKTHGTIAEVVAARLMRLSFRCTPGDGDMSDRKKLMALRDASVDARRKAALGLDMGDPSSLETLTRTHILIMALDAVIDELPPDADVDRDPAL
jgi:hypothetical protein